MVGYEPTPGEKVLDALGHLYEYWCSGAEDALAPCQIDVGAVAHLVGVWDAVEFVQGGVGDAEEEGRTFIHFPAEVLAINPTECFPWQLLGDFEWAERQEMREFWRYFH